MTFPDPRLIGGREVGVNFADLRQDAPGLNADALTMNALAECAGFPMRVAGEHAAERRGKDAASARAEEGSGLEVGPAGATVSQADGNVNGQKIWLQRAERGDAGQALNADWPARIFPSDHPSGFAAVNAEEAHERNIPIMLHMRAEEVKLQGRQLAHSASALLEYLRHVKGSIIALTVEVLLCDQMERQHWIIVRLPDKKAS